MASTPSLRRLWLMYKRLAASDGSHSKLDLLVAQAAFYAGARGVVRVLARLLERGDYDELHKAIKSHDRLLTKLQEKQCETGGINEIGLSRTAVRNRLSRAR